MWLQGIAIFASQGRADLENNCGQYDQLVFQKGIDSGELFDRLKISEADDCQKYKNKYNVIRIDFSKMPRNCESYRQYIERVEELLISDLREAYPDAKPVKQMRLEIFWKRSFNSIMAKNLFLFWTNGILFFTGNL